MPRKKQTPDAGAQQPPFVAAASFPESEEGLTTPQNEVAEAIREVAYAFRDLTEVLGRIFLASGDVQNGKPAPAPVSQPQTTTTQPAQVIEPKPVPVDQASSATPQAPPLADASPAPPPVQEAPPAYRQEDYAWTLQCFQQFHQQFPGVQTSAPQMVGSIKEKLPHLSEEAIWAMIRQVEALGFSNPTAALIRITPPVPSTQTPAMVTIL